MSKFWAVLCALTLAAPCVAQAQSANGAAASVAVSQNPNAPLSGEAKAGLATAGVAVVATLIGLGGSGGSSSSTTTAD
ncbi:hypothetical protein [Mangrovicoccus ximenensis]|uniref:hypothetical protein n=1 Tax=Mangrovicoccus ximenensis TaxID=1911570 RepID=UPI001F19E195|nr:hypothetical protein [Mangrovicoccus ximenensis]